MTSYLARIETIWSTPSVRAADRRCERILNDLLTDRDAGVLSAAEYRQLRLGAIAEFNRHAPVVSH